LSIANLVVNIKPANHSRLVEEWHVVHGPRLTSNFGADLYENLVADASHVLALRDGVREHHLGRHGDLLEQESLQVIVERGLSLGAREDEYDCLH